MASNDNVPGYGPNDVNGKAVANSYSGTREGGDPTNQPGQYPGDIFGVQLPQGTGAPGTSGATFNASVDPTNQPGQLDEGITGMGPSDTAETGSPGTQGAQTNYGSGSDSITFTPLSAGLGPYQTETINDSVSGPGDWTAANDQGYASGGPQLPGVKGNEPSANDGPFTPKAGGKVLRGGRSVKG